jgi:hypothetical protein
MVYTKDSEGFPNVGKYHAIRNIEGGRKGEWMEVFGSYISYLTDPDYEVIKYDKPGEKLPD